MNRSHRFVVGLGIMGMAASLVMAQPPKTDKPAEKPTAAKQPEGMPPLPPGWTQEDMAACAAAGQTGSQHDRLAKAVGTWKGKTKMWMGSGSTTPTESECTTQITQVLDGRFIKIETVGEIPGLGAFNGLGYNGFDNVSQKFTSTWMDSCGTGTMIGTGALSPDSKTLTWTYTYNCPIAKKPVTARQIERTVDDNHMTLEMWSTDPKTNKEYKMLEIAYERKGAAPTPAKSAAPTVAPSKTGELPAKR
jgi:hypothetical protein